MSFTPYSGTAGRVKLHSGSGLAGIQRWRINSKTAPIPTPHFEITADSNGAVWNTFLKGLTEATVTIEGVFDRQASTGTPFTWTHGSDLSLDLLFEKTLGFGYYSVAAFVTEFSPGTDVENKPATFTCTCQITGTLAAPLAPPPPP